MVQALTFFAVAAADSFALSYIPVVEKRATVFHTETANLF
jgi:hypothetical protein